nr:protein FAR1-RELATED SEQUENCE 5-like [Ipomoea batatas]
METTNTCAEQTEKNKCSGKRSKRNKGKSIEKSIKPKRKCRACNQLGQHDSRNCPKACLLCHYISVIICLE